MAAQRHACGKDAFHHWATDAAEKKPLGRLFLCLLSLLAPTPPCRPADADRRPRPACPVFVPYRGHDSHHLIAPPSLSRLLASGSPASQIAPVGLAEFFSRIGIPTSDPASTGGSRIRKRQAPPSHRPARSTPRMWVPAFAAPARSGQGSPLGRGRPRRSRWLTRSSAREVGGGAPRRRGGGLSTHFRHESLLA